MSRGRDHGRHRGQRCHARSHDLRGNPSSSEVCCRGARPDDIEDLVGVADGLDQLGVGREAGVIGVQALRVRENDQHAGTDEMRHDRRQLVVVAELHLVDDDRVVFVHDGNDAEFEHARQRGASVEILRAVA